MSNTVHNKCYAILFQQLLYSFENNSSALAMNLSI